MVEQDMDTTLPVTLEDMIHHTQSVKRGANRPLRFVKEGASGGACEEEEAMEILGKAVCVQMGEGKKRKHQEVQRRREKHTRQEQAPMQFINAWS
ncbi:hypothetical protein KRP22_008550 [Phytophthora ramorum]|nr:hypothetical protein KRP22_7382 [Phytophthora ramorum]KAH7501908.1 hypothetical protein KRP22_7383 [Phytophthora ramorum]